EPMPRVVDGTPGVEIGPWVGGEVVRRARLEQVGLVGEVAIEGTPLHTCTLRDGAHRRSRRADGSVELDRGLRDSQVRLRDLVGAPLELVLPLGSWFVTHMCVTNIDRFDIEEYPPIS